MCSCKDNTETLNSNTDPNLGYSWRKIAKGDKYDYLFGTNREIENKDILIDKTFDLDRVINLIKRTAIDYRQDTERLAQYLRTTTPKGDTIKLLENIWKFMYHQFQYKEDTEEQIRTPLRSWRDRVGGIDCDCYSVFISSLLLNLEIPHILRVTKYKADKPFQHIYVVVPHEGKEVIIDPVLHEFNYEKPFLEKIDTIMNIGVYQLTGTGDDEDIYAELSEDELLGILGGDDLGAAKKQNVFQKVFQKKNSPPPRTANPAGKKNDKPDPKSSGLVKFKDKVKAVINKGIQLNPLIAASRGGLLLFFMTVGKISRLLYPAIKYADSAAAAAGGITADAYKKAKDGLQRMEELHVKKMQGKVDALHKAITKGATKGKNGMKGFYGDFSQDYLDILAEDGALNGGLGDGGASAGLLATSLPVIIGAVWELVEAKIIDLKGKSVKDYAQDLMKDIENDPEAMSAMAAAQAEAKMGIDAETGGTGEDTTPTTGGGAMGWVRENPVKTGLLGLAVVGIGVAAYQMMQEDAKPQPKPQQKAKPLSGARAKTKSKPKIQHFNFS